MKTFQQFLAEVTISNPVLPEQNSTNAQYFIQFMKEEELSKTSRVAFALYAAKLVQHLNSDRRVTDCINLVEKWLRNPESVPTEELYNIGRSAMGARGDTSASVNAANAAANAAYATDDVDRFNSYPAAQAAGYAIATGPPIYTFGPARRDKNIKNKLISYISYLLKKEPKHNNFNHDSLRQNNPQAYSFLERISKLDDHQVTNDDLMGIYHVFDALEEIGSPLDLTEFQWEGKNSVYNDVTEKHRLLQTIRREFSEKTI